MTVESDFFIGPFAGQAELAPSGDAAVAREEFAELREREAGERILFIDENRDGRIATWGQLGLTGEWADKKIALHGMTVRRETGNPPGIVNFLEHRVLAGREWRDGITAHTDVTGGAQALELIVRAVAADPAALGYSGFGYAQPGTNTLALAETDAGPFFAGTAAEVARRDYPLARTIYLCVDRAPDALTRNFLRHVLTAEAQHAIAADAQKFFPLPAAALAAARAQLN